MALTQIPGTSTGRRPDGAAPPVTSTNAVVTVAPRIEARLSTLLAEERRRWALIDPDLDPPLEALERAVLGGGKRLRPTFCYWGFVAAGGDPDTAAGDQMERVGAAFELLHAFALVHDDVMDGAPLRRGRPTTHIDFTARHAEGGWRGESRRFGEAVAILVGDLAHSYAESLVRGLPGDALAIWNEVQIELMMGQYLDVLRTAAGRATTEQADRIARLKSGRYTVERPLQLGAAIAGATPEVMAALSAYGLPLGIAFQMRDDVLGAFGDPAVTGKPVGDDLREGKPTPMLGIALERADAAQRRILDRAGDPDLDDIEVGRIQDVLIDTGALAETQTRIVELTEAAVAAVYHGPFSRAVAHALVELAEFIAGREV